MINRHSIFVFILTSFTILQTHAAVIGPSVTELKFAYQATFLSHWEKSEVTDNDQKIEAAKDHAWHLWGLLQSETLTKNNGVDYYWVPGLGAPQLPLAIEITGSRELKGFTEITYTAKSSMIVHRKAAEIWVNSGSFILPLPYDLPAIYDRTSFKKFWQLCGDKAYPGPLNFPFFYDPFKRGCRELSNAPLARDTLIYVKRKISKVYEAKLVSTRTMKLDEIRGNNDNGDDFAIYIVHGYDKDFKKKNDEGRRLYHETKKFYLNHGFDLAKNESDGKSIENTYTKELRLGRSQYVNAIVKHLLVNTDNANYSETQFPIFWKEAVEEGDVVIYGGHSDVSVGPAVHTIAEFLKDMGETKIRFNNNKRQIFFMDACSSYTYYLDAYRKNKRRSKLELVSWGLPLYFENSFPVLETLLRTLIESGNPRWFDLLEEMEYVDSNGYFLLNVGGL